MKSLLMRYGNLYLLLTALLVFLPASSHLFAQTKVDTALITRFELEPVNSTNSGSIGLSWRLADEDMSLDGVIFELEEASDSLFATQRDRYIGPDLATYLSGLENGSYYFRVRAVTQEPPTVGPWSDPILIEVEHHSLRLAMSLFIIGGVVFLATVVVVVHGTKTKELA